MAKPHKLLFVLTDGGRARFVERSTLTGDLVTIGELDHARELRALRAELRASPPSRTFESASTQRHSVGREDRVRIAKEAFMVEVAHHAVALASQRGLEGVFLAAPRRLIGVLRERIGSRAHVAGVLGKDLTKAPDHELKTWLTGPLFALQPAP